MIIFFSLQGAVDGMFFSLVVLMQEYYEYQRANIAWSNAITLLFHLIPFLLLAIIGWWKTRKIKLLETKELGLWGIFGVFTIFNVGTFYPHHGMLLLTPLVLLGGMGLYFLLKGKKNHKIIGFAGIVILLIATGYTTIFFHWSMEQPWVQERAQIISERIGPTDPIYIWGYHSDLLWYLENPVPTPFYHAGSLSYGLLAGIVDIPEERKKELMEDFEENPPKIMVVILPIYATHEGTNEFFEKYYQDPEYPWLYQIQEEKE
jgi:hypothetical protein